MSTHAKLMKTLKRKPSVHNPVNFEPSDYKIIGYFDNVPPQASPMIDWADPDSAHYFRQMRMNWESDFKALFPNGNAYKCQHCGQGNVRYVVAAIHEKTGEHVCFGDICCERLNFEDHNAFAAAQIRSKAQAALKRHKLEQDQADFLKANQSFAEALKEARSNPDAHSRNHFASDIAHKFLTYGSLSEKQVAAFISSIARDLKYIADKAADAAAAPTLPPFVEGNKISMTGEILSIKTQYGAYGPCVKLLVKLLDGNKVWGSLPSGLGDAAVGDKVTFTATVTKSDTDEHFGFFKRPTKAGIEQKKEQLIS